LNQFLNETSDTSHRTLASIGLSAASIGKIRVISNPARARKFVPFGFRALAPAGHQQHFEVEPFAGRQSYRFLPN
jgi:hypothetical protein